MAQKSWKGHQAPSHTSITEAARRYHAVAMALAQSLGLPLAEVLRDYTAAVSTVYIEISRCEVRLPASVELPPLQPNPPHRAMAEAIGVSDMTVGRDLSTATNVAPERPSTADSEATPDEVATNVAPEPDEAAEPPLPVAIPQGLPCSGCLLVDLRPPQLSLLLGKVAALSETKGGAWTVLLQALQAERQARLAKGRPPKGAGKDSNRIFFEGKGVPHGR
jgi:hypothetical protein